MKVITKHIPNTLTSMNLLLGCIGIVMASRYELEMAGLCMLLAAVFDFFDGFAARLLKANSPIGLQLDSLADMVSFGVLPSMILFYSMPSVDIPCLKYIIAYFPFIIAIFSALRLAKFNIDTRQTETFIGLPTPANAMLIASAVISLKSMNYFDGSYWYVYILACIILSGLLVCEIPMFSIKFKKQESTSAFIKKYTVQIIFLLSSLLFIILFKVGGIALCILLYISVSITNWLLTKSKTA